MNADERRSKRHKKQLFVVSACICVHLRLLSPFSVIWAATLPNELATDAPLIVVARGAVGPYYRPGAWTVLRVAIENRGDPFDASVRVRETRGGRATDFVGVSRALLRRGTNSFEVLCAPGGPEAGTALEVVRLERGGRGGRRGRGGRSASHRDVVYRGDLWRVMRPLGPGDRLALGVGLSAFRLPEGEAGPATPAASPPRGGSGVRFVASHLGPRELPRRAEAYASVDLVALERTAPGDVAAAQVEALRTHLVGGCPVVMASFRALPALGLSPSGLKGAAGWEVPGDPPGGGDPPRGGDREGPGRLPPCNAYPMGLSMLCVFAAEAGDAAAWGSPPRGGSRAGEA